MKLIFSIISIILLFTTQAFSWGQNGHRAVGLVAEQHLTRKTKKIVMEILEDNSLAEVSNWMDEIKSDTAYNHTHDWHWVTIPDGMRYEQTAKNPNGDIIMKIEEIVSALKAGNLPLAKEREYLKYLVHLVGDLHQPMHVGGKDDQGGNAVKVLWFGQPSNLHRVWDSDMIDGKNLSYTELAHFLGKPAKAQVKQWQATSVREWAYDMMPYRQAIYHLPADNKLSYRYPYKHFDTVQHCLLQGGVRLAGLLNQIYG
ncbi:S1/P1 nuclease [Pontibacter beigongshangensis]|uniref:S1/P1 nuclease n=1 Tax=Pontibacter beigongshangensis TaxID=2574733 RepID=UPI0016502FE1|nr:S1/P1 nuclease [Pontibacter beigongshangensis]